MLSKLSFSKRIPTVVAKAVWVGDDTVLPTGAIVDILAVDHDPGDVPGKYNCWVRWQRTPDSHYRYRSCSISDLTIDENTIGTDVGLKDLITTIRGIIITARLPKQRWSCSDDESGTILTLNRQSRFIADQVSDAFFPRTDIQMIQAKKKDPLIQALKLARGWVVTCSQSKKAQEDLKVIDEVLEGK